MLAIILAALSLTLDFGSIDAGVEAGAPKFMEWYSAYGLMVTLIWLYLLILRLPGHPGPQQVTSVRRQSTG